jgi:hypothetical protein
MAPTSTLITGLIRLVGTAVGAGFFVLGASSGCTSSGDAGRSRGDLQTIAEVLNSESPELVDSDTRLDFVTIEGDALVYSLSLIDEGAVPEAELRQRACATTAIVGVLGDGYTCVLRYHDQNDAALPPLTVTPSDCDCREAPGPRPGCRGLALRAGPAPGASVESGSVRSMQ